MIKSVLLVYPPIDPEYYLDGVNDSPPLGLIVLQNYIQRYLKLDVNIDIVDGEYFTMEEILEKVVSGNYDMIGAQTMMASYHNTLKIMSKAKECGLKTVLGGHHATQLSRAIMKNRHDFVDYIICGDGEEAFARVIKEEPEDEIPNLVYFKDGKINCNPERNVPLQYGLIDYISPKVLKQYKRNIGRKLERYEKLISFRTYSHKGCSNRSNSQYCFFCGRADRGVRFKKPEDYVRELRYLSELPNVKYIFEIGDDFLQDPKWLDQVLDLLREKPITKDVHLKIFARANRITPEVIPILKELNIDEVAIGFESGSEEILRKINKNTMPQDNINAAILLFQNGIDTIASFVLGLPGENEESLNATYEQAMLIQKLSLKYLGRLPQEIIANIIEVNPGSPAFKKLMIALPKKYMENDDLDVYETQNDYFRMEFGLDSNEKLVEFRANLVKWGNIINQLGKYTYPAGFKNSEVVKFER